MIRFTYVAALAALLQSCTPSPTCTGAACGGSGGGSGGSVVEVRGTISQDTTWSKANTYVLKEIVYVDKATLTIEAGTKVLGDRGSALVTTRDGGKLRAVGTASAPIVFSANFPEGMRGVGNNNWGGIVLQGKAPMNIPGGDNLSEGLADEPRNRYGGGATPDAAYDCGTLKYVRIEFAGQPLTQNNELNGLTLNACGSATSIEYVQVHRGIDDGIELFGGTVNLKHVIMTGSDDDGLDWDQGWAGKGQFIIVQQLQGRGNHGIEADNNRNANDGLPRSSPTLFNVTLVGRAPDTTNSGEGTSRGMIFRVGTAGKMANMIVTNFNDFAMLVDGASSVAQWNAGALSVRNSLFDRNPGMPWQNTPPPGLADGGMAIDGFDEATALAAPSLANRGLDPQLTDPLNQTSPRFTPKAGSPALSGALVPPADDGFFDQAGGQFVGAVGPTDWTEGWTSYPEN